MFASNNKEKIKELQSSIGSRLKIISLKEAGIEIDIPEPFETIKENASEKSRVIMELTGKNCFSEDTGLEVDAVNGSPGVNSARYAGDQRDPAMNNQKLLTEMSGSVDRRARFKTVISLRLNGMEYFFAGIAEGTIEHQPTGTEGFGYDPIFRPLGANRTFAQMCRDEKAQYSHRRKAGDKLVLFLNKVNESPLPASEK
ncbi:MAG: RdgB/HAM1 family non-canonical purine NTP pyrophosphatase [Chitinophagaceae bacterium]